ncbi:MAG: 50S ribosomal protein L32e [Asgard group archaeon]|nr:50S ribosomal protein L32e [Asgard group archaeon]
MTVDKRLLREREKIRKSRPKFRRQESWRYKRLKKSWRKPIGIDNSMRHHKRGIPKIVRVGYRGPRATRGLTRAGMQEVLVHNIKELEQIDTKIQVARLGSKVGTKKKVAITNRADELDIKIINRPEEALTFATISEISEEILLDEDEKKPKAPKARKKRTSTSTELSAKELEELEALEASLAKKPASKKPAPKITAAKKTTPKKTTKPKSSSKMKVDVNGDIKITLEGKTYTVDKSINMKDLKAKRIPNAVKNKVAEIRGWKSWEKLS